MVIFVTETWFSAKISDSEIIADLPYSIVRCDRKGKRGGGVCLLIHGQITFHHFKLNPNLNSELICIDFRRNTPQPQGIILVYRPPKANAGENVSLCNLLCELALTTGCVTILGDVDLPLWTGALFLCFRGSKLILELFQWT